MAPDLAPTDWAVLLAAFQALQPGSNAASLVENTLGALATSVGVLPPEATDVLLLALAASQEYSGRFRLVYALGRAASANRKDVVDELAIRFHEWRRDAFLAPEVLDALASLAERSPLARSETRSLLLRLDDVDSRYLLVRAIKVIARLECLGFDTEARILLDRWTGHEDDAVRAEARQQTAVLKLYDTLLQEDLAGIQRGLEDARTVFTRAELSEEERLDARLFLGLVDLLLAYLDTMGSDDTNASALRTKAQELAALIANPMGRPWYGYASGSEAMLEYRFYRIADGFACIASAMQDAEEWTNFDEALVELAAVLPLMWDSGAHEAREGIAESLEALETSVVVPRLGPFLERVVGRARFQRVMMNHEGRHGNDQRTIVLHNLYEAALAGEYAGGKPQDPAVLAQLDREVEASPPEILLLPIDHPGCYGNDPSVDEAVRPILEAARARLGTNYSRVKWRRFVEAVIYVVQITRDIQDLLPEFALCEEDGGKGQNAGEGDLQEYVFQRLRQYYGRDALYEPSRIGGGRSDCGIRVPECEVPIEVKAEYRNVSRDHVQANYVGQVDDYATARDRLGVLLILDARTGNSARHVKRSRAARKSGQTDTPGSKLYSLREAFWITGMPGDPQITDAKENAVVVGLVQGNRAKPSSTTTYSGRPRTRGVRPAP
jgi:hypothetical protein